MGVITTIVCRKCKVARDIDKIHAFYHDIETREDALKAASDLIERKQAFREVLLMSFLHKHTGHDCVMFTDHPYEDDEYEAEKELDPYYNKDIKKDTDFFKE